jgi:cytosine deaminase
MPVELPAFVEPHAHLDKAFLADRVTNPSGDLMGAIEAMIAAQPSITQADIAERAERAARLMAANGVVAIRTHADTDGDGERGLAAVRALIDVRQRLRTVVDIQVCALVHWPTTGDAGAANREALAAAIELGVDVVGGCPHLEHEPEAAIDGFLDIAEAAGLPIDLHTDETLDPQMMTLEYLAERLLASGFRYGVTASHCVSLGVQPVDVQHRVAAKVAEAGIAVITLPHTNLYLLGREQQTAMPRGLTAVEALRNAGVVVAAGADNLQDPFNPVGRGDPLETASLMVLAGHVSPDDAVDMVSTHAATAIGRETRGSVVVDASSVRSAVAFAPSGRWRHPEHLLHSVHQPGEPRPTPSA